MLYSLSLANGIQLRMRNRLYRWSLFSMFFFFSVDIRSNQFRVDLIIKLLSLYSETLLQCIEIGCRICEYQVTFAVFLSVQALATC